MKTSVNIVGGKGLIAKFKRHPELILRSVESVITQEARALAVEYGSGTMPGPGMQDRPAEAFRKTVTTDIGRVYASRSNPQQIFQMIQQRDPILAKAYWHAYKAKKPRQMAALLTKAALPQGLNPADHAAARTGKNGRVRKNQRPVSVANDASLTAFIRKQRALVGFAKAGWFQAAKGLGGRVRRNLRDADGGNRKTEEIFPAYVRALARKFPGIGGASVLSDGKRVTVTIFTAVAHADVALTQPFYLSANSRAEEKMNVALTHAIAAVNQKLFKSA